VLESSVYSVAATAFCRALVTYRSIGTPREIARLFEGSAATAAGLSGFTQAAHLYGAAEALRAQIGAPMWPVDRPEYERRIAEARTQVGSEAWEAAWAAGRTLTWEQAADEALRWLSDSAASEDHQRQSLIL
jgi:hypothetical protein